MKHLLIFLLAFPFFASAQILEKQFVATVQYNGFTQINDSLYRGDLIEFRDVLIEGYQPSGVDSGFICLDGTGRAYRVEVVNSFDYSSLNVDLIELDDYDKIPVGVGIVAERYGSTYQIPNGLVNSIGISAVLQAKILNHNTKIAATTVQPPDTLYIQELSGTTAISNGDTIPLIDYVRVVDTPAMLLNYPSTAGYGIIDGGKTWRADTSDPSGLATRKYTLLNPTSIIADRSIRSNGTNLVVGNITDNGTKLEALKPWQFNSSSLAGLPTGVSRYIMDISDYDWFARYSSTAGAWIAPAQAVNPGGKFLAATIPYADANGRLKYGSYSELYFTSTDLVCYRAPYFSSNAVGIAGGIRVYNTNTTSGLGYGSIALYPSTGGKYAQFFCTNTLYPGYGVITAQSFGHYSNGPGGMAVQSDDPASSIRFGIGTTGTIEKMRINSVGVGIGRTPTASRLEVEGAGEFHGNSGIVYIGAYGSSPPDPAVLNTGYLYNTNTRFGIFAGQGFSVNDDVVMHRTSTGKVSIRAINDTVPGIGISLSKATFIREKLIIAPDSTFKFNPSTDVLQLSQMGAGNKEAADLSKTQSAYIASWATDGTLLDYPLSSLGNGIYGGSGTLSQHTTRARIPDDGNFLISQLFNSDADSAYIQVINGLDGNREVRLGVTDTMSTGFATLVLKQDTDNEVMSWQLRSSDNEGQTVLEGDGGNISASVDEGYEFQISGMVRAKREAYSEITSTSSPQTLSNTYSDNLINQGGTQATFTLNMPASPDDGQVCTITFNNAITTLTIDGNGETIVGSAVVTGVPGSQRKFKFYSGIGWIKLY